MKNRYVWKCIKCGLEVKKPLMPDPWWKDANGLRGCPAVDRNDGHEWQKAGFDKEVK